MTERDPRIGAFVDPDGPEVFTAIVHGNQVWTEDPFDVDSSHGAARAQFRRLLDRASDSDELPTHGKTLLLLGEAGSGKTHLMRAFRTHAHAHTLATGLREEGVDVRTETYFDTITVSVPGRAD